MGGAEPPRRWLRARDDDLVRDRVLDHDACFDDDPGSGGLDGRRRVEINEFLSTRAIVLAQLATSGTRLRDDTRPCLLSVFLTLINVCERVARSGVEERPEPAFGHVRADMAAAMRQRA